MHDISLLHEFANSIRSPAASSTIFASVKIDLAATAGDWTMTIVLKSKQMCDVWSLVLVVPWQ